MSKLFPPASALQAIIKEIPTPFHLYDEAAMRANAQAFYRAFAWVPGGFKNFFAVKALPNPYILDLVRQVGMGGDCSSLAELRLCEAAGIRGENIIFTSNDTPAKEFQKADEMGALINLDDLSHIEFLETALGGRLPEFVCFRYNPGPLKAGNAIIGKPEEAKYGFTREQLFEGYRMLRDKGVVEYVEAARMLKARCPGARFALLGFLDVENVSAISRAQMDAWVAEGVIEYWGETHDVRPMIARADCVVLPSYREGMPRTLLEAAAMARPLVASDVPGCREVVSDGVNGFLCEVKSASALAQAMAQVVTLSPAARQVLGNAGRSRVEQAFALDQVVDCYLQAIRVVVKHINKS